jgi:hypothetical protein
MAASRKQCTACGEDKRPTIDFYLSRSKLYKFNDGRMPICKECLSKLFKELNAKYSDEVKALYHLCMLFDIYFDRDLVEKSSNMGKYKNDDDNLLKSYMKNVNSLNQYKFKDSMSSDCIVLDDSLIKEEKENIEEDIYEEREMTPELKKLCLKRWGSGYSDEDYLYLEDNYAEFYEAYAHDTPAERMLLMNITKTLLEGEKSRKSGDKKGYENMLKLVSSMLTDAAIKPSQKKTMGDEVGECFGVFIENLEKNEPVNEAIDEFADVDNIGKLIDRQFVKNFAKVFGLVGDDDENED